MNRDEILNSLTYHPPTPATIPMFEANRKAILNLALTWSESLPAGRHAALAQTHLQTALFFANAAVACDYGETD
jgi:hypothetical protein